MVSRHHCAALTRCAAAVATALLSLQASAQAQSVTTAPEAPGLSTITVTGNWLDNPSEEKVLEHPGARSIVERKRIEETGSSSLRDVLRLVPGVQVQDSNGTGGSDVSLNIGVRGLTARLSPRSYC
jgi:Fe(3+) dicitrate transport protein